MSEFTLEAAELAFLLTMVDATAIPGVELDHLFPAGQAARDEILVRGGKALAAHGHFRLEGSTFYDMNPALPVAAAVLAAPHQVIHTTAYTGAAELQAAHYLSDSVAVEFYILPDNKYRVVVLDNAETAVGRIAHNLGLDVESGQSAWTHTIPHDRMAGESDLLAAASVAVADAGTEPTISRRVALALAEPRRIAEIDLVRIAGGDLVMRHSVLLFDVGGTAGMLYHDPVGATTVTVPAGSAFTTQLLSGIHALQALNPAHER